MFHYLHGDEDITFLTNTISIAHKFILNHSCGNYRTIVGANVRAYDCGLSIGMLTSFYQAYII